mmetsp:Transcript_11503/g.31828  ORF Transcript_11503/g.31828 Transcript_11503/m.31828 type:complete len:345 (-) Transcript_11503:259-1293(-)
MDPSIEMGEDTPIRGETEKESRFDEVVKRAVRTPEPFSPVVRTPSHTSSDAASLFVDEDGDARRPPTPQESRKASKPSPALDATKEESLAAEENDIEPLTPPRVERFQQEHEEALAFYDNIHHNPFVANSENAASEDKLTRQSPATQPYSMEGGEHSFTGSVFGTVEGDPGNFDGDDLYGDYSLPGRESLSESHLGDQRPELMVDNVPSSFQGSSSIGGAYEMIFSSFGLAPGDTVGSQHNTRKDRSPGRTSQTGADSHGDIEHQKKESNSRKNQNASQPPSILATKVLGPFRLDCMIASALLLIVVVMGVAIVAALLKDSEDGGDDGDTEMSPSLIPTVSPTD